MDYALPAAPCPLHAQEGAQSICTRCGNFMCGVCTGGGTWEACPNCRQLTGDIPGFVWTRQNHDLGGILSFVWGRFQREWVMLSLAALIYGVVVFAAGLVNNVLQLVGTAIHPAVGGGLAIGGAIVQYVVQAVISGGLAVVLYDVMKGRAVDLGRMFGQFRNFSTYFIGILLVFALSLVVIIPIGIGAGVGYAVGEETGMLAGIGVGSLIAVVPAVWLLLPWMFLEMEIALGGERSGVQALMSSFKLADGNRLWMVLYWILGLVFGIAGLLAFCVGALPAFALATMLKLGLYLALRNGAGLSPMRGDI